MTFDELLNLAITNCQYEWYGDCTPSQKESALDNHCLKLLVDNEINELEYDELKQQIRDYIKRATP